jgi:membrane protease YdiL (CAAX protease family)
MSQTAGSLEVRPSHPLRKFAKRRPLTAVLASATALTLTAQTICLLMGWNVMPAKLVELVLLVGGSALVTAWLGGRAGLLRLFAGVTRWRIGLARYLLALAALPVLTVIVAAVTGTMDRPAGGWVHLTLIYLLFLVFGAVSANLWEETAWAGFVQGRLMARHGLLAGSLLTAVPFFLIHLPLAFEIDGWKGTSWNEAFTDWAFLLVSAPFFRYLIATVLVDTGGSILAVGLLHASFNASGALSVTRGGWQYIPAMIALTVLVTAYRTMRGRSAVHGYAPNLLTDQDAALAARNATPAAAAAAGVRPATAASSPARTT